MLVSWVKRGLLPTWDMTLHLVKAVELFHRIDSLGTSSTPRVHLGRFSNQHKTVLDYPNWRRTPYYSVKSKNSFQLTVLLAFLPNLVMFWEEHTHKPLQNWPYIRDVQPSSEWFPFDSKWRRKSKIGEQTVRLERVEIVCSFLHRHLQKLQNCPLFQMSQRILSWRELYGLDMSFIHVNKRKWTLWTFLVIWYFFLPPSSTLPDIVLYWILCIHLM